MLKLPDSNQFYKKIVGRVEFELKYKIINKKKKRLNQRFSSVLIRIECLLNFCIHKGEESAGESIVSYRNFNVLKRWN